MKNCRTTLLCAAFAFLCVFSALRAAASDRPNIVYIALEDITPMFGCYGDSDAKTPNFDKLAAEGVRYTRAYSAGPVCSVSRSSIVSGMYPYRYQRNFYTHLPYRPFYADERAMMYWFELARAGKLTGDLELMAARFKPVRMAETADRTCRRSGIGKV